MSDANVALAMPVVCEHHLLHVGDPANHRLVSAGVRMPDQYRSHLTQLDEAKAASAEASDTVKEFAAVAGEARAQVRGGNKLSPTLSP